MIHPDIVIDVSVYFGVGGIGLFLDYFEQHSVDTFLELLCGVFHQYLEHFMHLNVKLFVLYL